MQLVKRHWATGVTVIASAMVIASVLAQPTHWDWRYLGVVAAIALFGAGAAIALRS